MMSQELAARVAGNLRQLRQARGLTQQEMARLSGLPRATWSNLESGGANPTLTVLHRAALSLQVSIEELISPPRATVQFYPRGTLPSRRRGGVVIRKLLPDLLPSMEIERLELAPGSRLIGVPHTPGTREYLTCESGVMVLSAAKEQWKLKGGDVVAFSGDQRHTYMNPFEEPAVGYSVVILTPLTPTSRVESDAGQ